MGSDPAGGNPNGIFWDIMGYYGRQWKALTSARLAGIDELTRYKLKEGFAAAALLSSRLPRTLHPRGCHVGFRSGFPDRHLDPSLAEPRRAAWSSPSRPDRAALHRDGERR